MVCTCSRLVASTVCMGKAQRGSGMGVRRSGPVGAALCMPREVNAMCGEGSGLELGRACERALGAHGTTIVGVWARPDMRHAVGIAGRHRPGFEPTCQAPCAPCARSGAPHVFGRETPHNTAMQLARACGCVRVYCLRGRETTTSCVPRA